MAIVAKVKTILPRFIGPRRCSGVLIGPLPRHPSGDSIAGRTEPALRKLAHAAARCVLTNWDAKPSHHTTEERVQLAVYVAVRPLCDARSQITHRRAGDEGAALLLDEE